MATAEVELVVIKTALTNPQKGEGGGGGGGGVSKNVSFVVFVGVGVLFV